METNIPLNAKMYGTNVIKLEKLFHRIMEYVKLSLDLKEYPLEYTII